MLSTKNNHLMAWIQVRCSMCLFVASIPSTSLCWGSAVIFSQPLKALLRGFTLKCSHTYHSSTVIRLPFKLPACKQVFPNPPHIDGMAMMPMHSTKPGCVLWLHSMETLTNSIQDSVIKVNPKSHVNPLSCCYVIPLKWKRKSWEVSLR